MPKPNKTNCDIALENTVCNKKDSVCAWLRLSNGNIWFWWTNKQNRGWCRVRVGGWEGNKYVLAVSHLIRQIDTDHSYSVSGRNRASEWVSEREQWICVTDQRMHRTPLSQLVCLMKCVPWQDRAKWFKPNQPGLPSSTSNEPRNCQFFQSVHPVLYSA